jgi:hypothetical protein
MQKTAEQRVQIQCLVERRCDVLCTHSVLHQGALLVTVYTINSTSSTPSRSTPRHGIYHQLHIKYSIKEHSSSRCIPSTPNQVLHQGALLVTVVSKCGRRYRTGTCRCSRMGPCLGRGPHRSDTGTTPAGVARCGYTGATQEPHRPVLFRYNASAIPV